MGRSESEYKAKAIRKIEVMSMKDRETERDIRYRGERERENTAETEGEVGGEGWEESSCTTTIPSPAQITFYLAVEVAPQPAGEVIQGPGGLLSSLFISLSHSLFSSLD